MFTGIIESVGKIEDISLSNGNINLTIASELTPELKIDQSVSHNGICLTVVAIENKNYTVTAINETIEKTTIKFWQKNQLVNLERAMILGARLDGHLVQGHVDQVAKCIDLKTENGSWIYTFEYDTINKNITVEKGSITVNGTSLTVINSKINQFSVAIIPYTYENTVFKTLQVNDFVNLEFDIVGKYISRMAELY